MFVFVGVCLECNVTCITHHRRSCRSLGTLCTSLHYLFCAKTFSVTVMHLTILLCLCLLKYNTFYYLKLLPDRSATMHSHILLILYKNLLFRYPDHPYHRMTELNDKAIQPKEDHHKLVPLMCGQGGVCRGMSWLND